MTGPAAEAVQIEPGLRLVIEDAPAGIEAALSAGMTVIALTTTHAEEELSAAHRVIGPEGVAEAVLPLLSPDAVAV